MAIRVTLECGHASMLRVRTTPQGYTHDWEVFVRGIDNADISQYVDKIVFHLHETFPKPKRVLKEPPYVVKESGYAGFVIPIEIYLKNKDEPKRIQISYDLILKPSGPAFNNVIRHNELFANPSEEFRKKLLKGGGIVVSGGTDDSGEKSEYKMVPPMVSKPKLSGTDASRKHRTTDLRSSNSFADLFGNPMTLPAKVSPETKRSQQPEKLGVSGQTKASSGEKAEKLAKPKHSPHKDKRKEKSAEERKDKRDKMMSKEKDRVKDKPKRPPSPIAKEDPAKRIPANPPPTTTTATPTATTTTTIATPGSPSKKSVNLQESPKSKDHKKIHGDREKPKDGFKVPVEDRKFDRKKKKHKDDKGKDRAKDKEHERPKESSRKTEKKLTKPDKHEKHEKDKNPDVKVSKDEKKSPKHQKEREKIRGEGKPEATTQSKEIRGERDRQRHKHKRKDKKERNEESAIEKSDAKKCTSDKKPPYSSPTSNHVTNERDSDSAPSPDEENVPKIYPAAKAEIADPSGISVDTKVPSSPSRNNNPETRLDEELKRDGKSANTKISRNDESRKRKRKLEVGHDEQHAIKRGKEREHSVSPSVEPVSSSQSPISSDLDARFNYKETVAIAGGNQPVATATAQLPIVGNDNSSQNETEQVAPDSTNNTLVESDNPDPNRVFSDDYVSQLKELQKKIMTLQDNQELQRVVQVIAETGQYEITKKTFDFDLCALDRRTVLRLQQFFSTS